MLWGGSPAKAGATPHPVVELLSRDSKYCNDWTPMALMDET
jgi:hypothetical protein